MQFLTLAAILSASPAAFAQDFILHNQKIPYDQIPYQVDTSSGVRGPQAGYNICNFTTEGPKSLCQTAFVNTPDDWCLWAPQEPNSVVGDIEGEMVAWCTKKGHGTRIISQGAITGMSWIQTSKYIQVTGKMNQILINMAAGDGGGEMDPHGADLRGNPIGGLMYSTAFSSTGSIKQTSDWTQFTGDNQFCMTVCNAEGTKADNKAYCNNLYDRLGCSYNAPGNYPTDLFEQCKADLKDPIGIYTGPDGVVSTYQQPPESLGPISSVPYEPRLPASSECTSFTSSVIFADALTHGITSSDFSTASVNTGTSSSGFIATDTRSAGSGSTTSSAVISTQSGSSNADIKYIIQTEVVAFIAILLAFVTL